MARHMNIDVYFSTDVEADGPVPGPGELLQNLMAWDGR